MRSHRRLAGHRLRRRHQRSLSSAYADGDTKRSAGHFFVKLMTQPGTTRYVAVTGML